MPRAKSVARAEGRRGGTARGRHAVRTVMIAGKGRSGTTWLAQIMNSYEHCSYKHEPFLGQKPAGRASSTPTTPMHDISATAH